MSADLVTVELDDPRWNELVSASPGALPVHHPDWARLIADCYGFRAFGLLLAAYGVLFSTGLAISGLLLAIVSIYGWALEGVGEISLTPEEEHA